MQRNNLAEIALNENISKLAVMGTEKSRIRAIQAARGEEPCFMSEKRLVCKIEDCEWRGECRRLIAAWKR